MRRTIKGNCQRMAPDKLRRERWKQERRRSARAIAGSSEWPHHYCEVRDEGNYKRRADVAIAAYLRDKRDRAGGEQR